MSTQQALIALQKDIEDMIESGSSVDDIYSRNQQRLVTFSLASNKHIEVLYHDMDDISVDNISEAKIVMTGMTRAELVLSEEEIQQLADKGYF
ncbi:hypothetical protein [Vibrio owensii]|uniref:hypothetical protein n=1 Tax=Vibrio harveyi group TaxID=717610 RepID=UPI003CC50D69